jgi:hypothetical protein
MWLRVLLLLVASTAFADRVKFINTLKGQGGNWAAYEGQRLVDGKLVAHRVIAQLSFKDTQKRLVWYEGATGKEKPFFEQKLDYEINPLEVIDDLVVEITHTRTDNELREPTLEATKCKLGDKTIDCTTLRFMVNGYQVSVEMAEIPGIGILGIEVNKNGLEWKMRVTGYGTAKQSTWGEAMPQAIESTPLKAGVTVGEVQGELDKPKLRMAFLGNEKLIACYVATGSKTKGTATAKFTIGKDGAVTTSKADGVAATCVADAIKAMKFAPGKRTPVTAVLTFYMQ